MMRYEVQLRVLKTLVRAESMVEGLVDVSDEAVQRTHELELSWPVMADMLGVDSTEVLRVFGEKRSRARSELGRKKYPDRIDYKVYDLTMAECETARNLALVKLILLKLQAEG